MPTYIPKLDKTMKELSAMTYQETAYEAMKLYLTDYTEEELKDCIARAYDHKFDIEEIVSFAKADFADVEGTRIIVFYPKDGVSRIQELQMLTQKGENTHVVAIHGNFDHAQSGVKKIFGDQAFADRLKKAGIQLSSANSINIGRLVPQIVYYVYAYGKLLENGELLEGEKINVTVPTGNFGNMICASNENKVLYDFFQTGTYDRNRDFILTTSPSMKGFMKDFSGGYASEEENRAAIRQAFEDSGYLMDTHTGVAGAVYHSYRARTGDETKTVIASTASPYKFPGSVLEAITGDKRQADDKGLQGEGKSNGKFAAVAEDCYKVHKSSDKTQICLSKRV